MRTRREPTPRRTSASLVACVAGLAFVVVGCASTSGAVDGDGVAGAAEPPLEVVATTSILADFAREVGGERVEVTTIIKPNVDAHDFEPAPADIEALATADVVLRNGVGLEKWFDRTIEAAEPEGEVVDTSTGVDLREAGTGSDDHDPHIWQSPLNAKVMVDNVERAFVEADPDGAATYEANADAYRAELDALDAEVADRLGALENRRIVTNHDALGYYIDRYDLEFVGSIIPSFDSSAELSATDVDAIVAAIRDHDVQAVFSESSIPPETAEAIATEAGVVVVAGDDALYGDALGPEGSGASTYLDMIRHNTEVLVVNLS